jgi:helix-turn-helix protein
MNVSTTAQASAGAAAAAAADTADTARRMKGLVDPIHMVSYFSPEPDEALMALGFRTYWDGYFAARSAPLGRVPAEVVHAAFYNFADGEVARHIPRVWEITTPEAALAAREQGCVAALRRILGDIASGPGVIRADQPIDGGADAVRGAPVAPRTG